MFVTPAKIILVFTIFGLSLFYPKPLLAANEFATSFHSTYSIQENGNTNVIHDINLTNNLANIYLTKYMVSLGSSNVENLRITSNNAKLPSTTNKTNNGYNLDISIPQPVIGKDQTLNLNISYLTRSITTSYGYAWSINIPKLAKANEFTSFERTVVVPPGMGDPVLVIPRPTSQSRDEHGTLTLKYIGFPNDSISLFFNEEVHYRLKLLYGLTNPTSSRSNTEIALPPDTQYQKITLDQISPPPSHIRIDSDGNWLAEYALEPNSFRQVEVVTYVSVRPQAHYLFPHDLPSNSLTNKAKYWETDAPNVTSLALQLKSPEHIYKYLVDNFQYDYGRVGVDLSRLGAAQALNEPSRAVCTEFTDAFVALARAASVPAREINGIAYLTNPAGTEEDNAVDILHAWPEYFDQASQTWLQVDPTLGSTTQGLDYFSKLDFSHIALVKHGAESDYPLVAGEYELSDSSQNYIEIEVVPQPPDASSTYELSKKGSTWQLVNTGNVALVNHTIQLPDDNTYQVRYLPPLGVEQITPHSASLGFFSQLVQTLKDIYRSLISF